MLDVPSSVEAGADGPSAPGTGERSRRRSALVVAALASVVGLAAIWLLVAAVADDDGPERSGAPTSRALDSEAIVPPTVASVLSMPASDGLVVPTLPTIGTPTVRRVDPSVLAADVLRMTADVPRRATTRIELGNGGYVANVSILRDPANDRFLISLDTGAGPSWAIIDVADATVYYSADRREWASTDDSIGVQGLPYRRMGEIYERLLDGPLRPDTLGAATVDDTGTTRLADGRSAAAYTVELPGSAIPLWQLYYLAPRGDFAPSDRPGDLVYQVSIGDDREVVVGISDVGGIAQIVRHEVELLSSPIAVGLPSASSIDIDPADD
jgi:hypothetical protein